MEQSTNAPSLSEIREELRRIIGGVLQVDVSEVEDDVPLLEYITSSLTLVAGMRQVYDRFGVLISIRRVLEGQANLASLSSVIAQALSVQGRDFGDVAGDGSGDFEAHEIPLHPSQRHIGFLCRYSSGASAAYNEPIAVRLEGELHAPALQAAVEVVGERYEALRTALSPNADTLELRSGQRAELGVSHCTTDELGARVAEIATRPFTIGERLFRAELLRVSDTDHVLVMVGHALLLDRRALEVVVNDTAQVYGLIAGGSTVDASPPGMQRSEFLAALENIRTAKDATEAYWKSVFADGIPRLELPCDYPRPPTKGYTGVRLLIPIKSALSDSVEAWTKKGAVEPVDVWFGAFTAFLHRLSAQSEIVAGIELPTVSKLERPAVARTRDMKPILSHYDSSADFASHVAALAALRREAEENAQAGISFSELIQALDVPPDQSRSPIFSVAFRDETWQPAPAFDSLHGSYLPAGGASARYDMELSLISSEAGLQLCCDFSDELFQAGSVTRWIEGLLEFVRAGVEDPARPCGQLPVMTGQDLRLLLEEWNATDQPYPRDRTPLDLIAEQMQTRGEAIAIRCAGREVSYEKLAGRVEELEQLLRSCGVVAGDRVAILLPRSPDLVATMLAIWGVGAAYVPLDERFPQQRLEYMLSDAAVSALVTTRDGSDLVGKPASLATICLDVPEREITPVTPREVSDKHADTAYVMYTSGSTGRPKGVQIKHSALSNFLLATRKLVGFAETDSLLAITTVSFDISCLELFVPLLAGGTVEIGDEGLAFDGIRLAESIEHSKPSYVQATPSTWKTLLAAGWGGDEDLCILSAGEAISRDLAERLLPRCHAVWNLYGPTETTVYSTAYQVESGPNEPMRIGRPYPNTRIYILDAELQPVPIGAIGELYIGGVGLARGYWGRSELTEERFVPNPFRAGERMYRTGDLARYLPNGDLVCLGRVDDQVKIHGVRIELGEVESALRGVDGVHDAVATSWVDASGNAQLVGHVLARGNGQLQSVDIRARLRESLPETMIPPYIVFAESFPLTANGKIRRASLPAPQVGGQSSSIPKSAPETPTERLLARAWSDVLGIDGERIGRDDEFMELGGHSLLMTQLMLEVRKLFHVSFSMRDFFDAPTLKEFALLLDEHRRTRASGGNGRRGALSERDEEWGKQRMAFLKREAELPANITPARGLAYDPPDEFRTVLMTGATGFVGAYLVSEILQSTNAELFCLVRPKQGTDGKSRIEHQMRAFALWKEEEAFQSAWNERLHIVEGDVILPRLGLIDSAYESLAREVDCIIHSAAHVNFIYPYEALRATNVLGVHEIIRFAFFGRIKPVHYLSTAAVWPMGSEYTFYERDPLNHGKLLNLGYDEAKWVGEQCLVNAEERGLPTARYRPAEVGGDSVTGRSVLSHFFVAAFKGFLQFGVFPSVDTHLDVTPVDYVARALVHLAFRSDPLGRAFHLTNPQPIHMSDALAYLRDVGYQFDELPFEVLRDRLVQDSAFVDNELFPYQAALEDMDERSFQIPRYDCQQTLRKLRGSGIECPPVDEKLLGTYLRYLTGIGFLPEPPRLAAIVGA